MSRHFATLGLLLLLVGLTFWRVSNAYFCGYDDFLDLQRAELVDRVNPSQVFTTTHYNSFKYRPLYRAANLAVYLVKPGAAWPFRYRNVLFHAIAVCAVYWLALLLFESWAAAATAAFLFAIHPLANQPINAACFPITSAGALFVLTLALFFFALKRTSVGWLVLALTCGATAVFVYESSIVLPAVMAGWWVLDFLFTRRLPTRRFVVVFVVVGGILFGSYLAARHQYAHGAATLVFGPSIAAKSLVQYAGALLLPVDLVLAHDWFGTPLPSEIQPGGVPFAVRLLVAGGGTLLIALLWFYRRKIGSILAEAGWPKMCFLVLAMLLSIAPFLFFTDHVSETYIYLPAAFYCILLARLVMLIPPPTAKVAVAGALGLLFLAATWDRNERVYRCGTTAEHILSSLPIKSWGSGAWEIDVAKAPGTASPVRYGVYNYEGLDTIAPATEYGEHGIEGALQALSRNGQLAAHLYSADELPGHCMAETPKQACYWIDSNGGVSGWKPTH